MDRSSPPRVLLHVCCGPCATHCVHALRSEYAVTLFFSNSNIWPREEYERRFEASRALAAACAVPLVEDAYDHAAWRARIRGFEHEAERGRRCELCFGFSLERTARYARAHGFECFTTTLTVSPHKSSPAIFRIGARQGPFLEVDFKKKDGFKRSVELSEAYKLYRQDFCGCEYSRGAGGTHED